jgi:hypothetical protein
MPLPSSAYHCGKWNPGWNAIPLTCLHWGMALLTQQECYEIQKPVVNAILPNMWISRNPPPPPVSLWHGAIRQLGTGTSC